ncbi:hypothetical protein BDV3_002880 [Batrachochytrium dendrobatidis]|nr:protein required for normal CLN1 and CLN2 G1 cyclin expression [Batrachochytrium dendrobatidis]KAK5672433.1 protein required for normal CLN1 and CLN2 G1 cyclin expression [Batrachochytrium dendrobatidis]
MAATSIEIPLLRSGQTNEVLEVDLNDLRANHDHIIDILTSEDGSLSLFLEFAFQYLKRDMVDEFEIFLQKGREIGQARNSRREENSLILILNTLASHYIEKAKSESDPSIHDQFIANATQILNDAERLDRMHLYTIVGKANVMLSRNQLDQALYTFRGALNQEPNFLPALIGSSCVHFLKQDFKSALAGYQTILRINPTIKPDVRIPIGICFHRLGMEKKAHAAFLRAVSLNPDNLDALALLSILENNRAISTTATPEEKNTAMTAAGGYLARGYRQNNRHSIIFNLMSDRFFSKGDYGKARVFSESALRLPGSKMSCADSYALRGKIAQAEMNYDLAYTCFVKASELNPDSVLIQFGLGQLQIYKKQFDEAMVPLEKVLAKVPDNYEALAIATEIYAQLPDSAQKVSEKLDRLKKIFRSYFEEEHGFKAKTDDDEYINDPELLIVIGCYFSKQDLKQAEKAFDRAIRILETIPDMSVAPELFNNLGALYHLDAQQLIQHASDLGSSRPTSLGDPRSALQLLELAKSFYDRAFEASPTTVEPGDASDILQTTVRYNLARLNETLGDTEKAKAQYLAILNDHPAYVDCLLRLGYISQNSGDNATALDRYSDALAIDENNVKAWSLVANAHLESKALRPARKAFEKILQEIDKYDMFSLCSTGNMCLKFARTDSKQRDIHCKRAVEFFTKALRLDSRNMYAATGIAIAFAYFGDMDEAREILTQIQEAAGTNINVTLNLAHILVELGLPHSAIPLYESIKKRSTTADIDVIRSLARAHYIIAKTEKLPDAMATVAARLKEACDLKPNDLALQYNLALAKQQYAQILNEQPKEKRPLSLLRSAVIGLEASEKTFEELSKHKPNPQLGYDVERAKERAKYSKGVRRTTEKKIHETEVLDSQREERLAEIRAKREEAAEIKRSEEKQRALNEQLRLEELDRKRRELQAIVQEDNEKMRVELEMEKAKPIRRKAATNEDDEDDMNQHVDQSEADGFTPSKGKQKRKRKEKMREKQSSDEAQILNTNSTIASDDEDEMMMKRAKVLGVRSKLSTAVIGESDEEE